MRCHWNPTGDSNPKPSPRSNTESLTAGFSSHRRSAVWGRPWRQTASTRWSGRRDCLRFAPAMPGCASRRFSKAATSGRRVACASLRLCQDALREDFPRPPRAAAAFKSEEPHGWVLIPPPVCSEGQILASTASTRWSGRRDCLRFAPAMPGCASRRFSKAATSGRRVQTRRASRLGSHPTAGVQ